MIESVGIIIRNELHEVLLQKKTSDYDKAPDCWTFIGGTIELGETPVDAIYRETKEEIGFNLSYAREVHCMGPTKLRNAKLEMFVAHVDSDLIRQVKIGEGNGLAFFRIKDVLKQKLSTHTRQLAKRYLNVK